MWIALKWKNDFQNYDEAVSCMRVINSGTGEDWEYVLGVWKNDFNDPDNFRSALTKACGDDIRFHDLMSRGCRKSGCIRPHRKGFVGGPGKAHRPDGCPRRCLG